MREYDQEILRVLTEAGDEGLSVQKISRHVFNACNSFFSVVAFEDIHHYVAQYLLRNSKYPSSIIVRADRGVYRLNLSSQETQQLVLLFRDEPVVEEPPKVAEDLSLSLF